MPTDARVSIEVSGPILDGMADELVARYMPQFAYAIAQAAHAEVSKNLDASIQYPTPYYETQITNERRADDWVVHDRGIVYGPWLEGTGSRNRTTRFKGYASFRRAAQTVQGRVPQLVERELAHLADVLGGG